MQASATPQNVMKMGDMAVRTARLWLDYAEAEECAPKHSLPPDPYNQAFYRFTRKDPDNEVSSHSSVQGNVSCHGWKGCQFVSNIVNMQAYAFKPTFCGCSRNAVGVQKVAHLIGQESLETLLQLATRDRQILCM